MTLELFDRFDMGNPGTGNNTGYFATGNFVAAPAQADGCNWRVSGNNGQTSIVLYYERFDVVFSRVARRDNNQFLLARVAPLLETNTGSLYGLDADTAFSGDGIYVDQYDLVGDTQPFYLVIGGQAGPVREVDPLNTANVLNADVFPGYQPAGNGLSSPTLGHFSSVGDVVFFRGLGTGGLALHCRGNANTDGVAAETGVTFLVDLDTDLADEILWDATETLFGSSVSWEYIQFVQDSDSTLANPKGQIFEFATGLTDVPVANTHRWFHQRRDWNPNDVASVAGVPNRVHKRRTLLTAFEVVENACPGSPNGVPDTFLNNFTEPVYVPSTSQIWAMHSDLTLSATYASCETVTLRFSESAAVDLLTDPAMVGDVTTNKTVRFRQEVRGSLSEPIGGVVLNYTLDRRSSKGEILPVTPTAGESVAVANAPINIVGAVVVREDATLLTEGVDYNLTRDPGGSVDFIAPKPLAGPVYTVDYPHFQTGATPSNGTLLDTTAITDVTGTAEVRVKYADNAAIVGEFDGLEGVQP